MAEIFNQSEQCQTRFKSRNVTMWPVNALRLEWSYDTGNDKNVTIIRLSMQLRAGKNHDFFIFKIYAVDVHDFFYLNQIYRLTLCNLKSQ